MGVKGTYVLRISHKKETPRLASLFQSIIIFTIFNRFQLTIYLFHDIILSIFVVLS